MGRRCGCVGKECNCAIIAGRGVSISGEGTGSVPLVLTQSAAAYMRGYSTDETATAISGSGVAEDPYWLSMDFIGVPDARPLSITDYTNPGDSTWVRPEGCVMVEVLAIGGGAGGNGGAAPAGGSSFGYGGLGGQGGGWTRKVVHLPPGEEFFPVRVGYGGNGATGAGGTGGAGTQTSFRITNTAPYIYVYAEGGQPAQSSGFASGGGGLYTGHQPTVAGHSDLSVESPAPGGGGRGANGNASNTDWTAGGTHVAYNGKVGVTDTGMGADGGGGGLAFLAPGVLAAGSGGNGYGPGGGGGGGRGGGTGIVSGEGTWTFPPGWGGTGARGFLRVIAY